MVWRLIEDEHSHIKHIEKFQKLHFHVLIFYNTINKQNVSVFSFLSYSCEPLCILIMSFISFL